MKFLRQESFKEISQFCVFANQLFIVSKNKQLAGLGDTTFSCYGIEQSQHGLFCYTNIENVETTIIFKDKSVKKVPKGLNSSCFNGENTLIFEDYDFSNYTHKVGLLNVHNGHIKWFLDRLSIGQNIRQDDIVYHQQGDTTIKAFCLITGNYIWEQILKVSKIIKILGCYADKLVLTYEITSHQSGTLAFDIHTGEIVWNTEGGNFLSTLHKVGETIVHLQSGSLWFNTTNAVKGVNIFKEINIRTGKVTREGVLTNLDNLGLSIQNFIVEGDYIYFTACYQGSFGAIVLGVLNYEYLNLLGWQIVDLDKSDGFGNFLVGRPVISGNKLYVLDKTGVLHFFNIEADTSLSKTSKSCIVPFYDLRLSTPKPPCLKDENLPF